MNALTRRWGVNLGLLILAGGLAASALLEPDGEHLPMAPSFLGVSPVQIEHIEVLRLDQGILVFVRRDGHWWMTAPSSGPANPVLLNQLLQEVTAHCPRQYSAAQLDLKALSLDPPRLRLRLNEQEIRFGAAAPMDGLRYLQTGDIVHLCPNRLYRLLTSAAASFLAPPIKYAESPASQVE
ncbi:MAG TPA: hypothetical protein PK820_12915 [Candidatus Competibacteraceae bacterium]|nr:hypothetical protein [Candidatus Competibacteraceae bacterium]HPF59675.1 hypothetical protein [Candidatus Competibacteraceae bacterium]